MDQHINTVNRDDLVMRDDSPARERITSGPIIQQPAGWRFKIGDKVYKPKGSCWAGKVVGYYSTYLTPEGYAVESQQHLGSVQLYPAAALEPL